MLTPSSESGTRNLFGRGRELERIETFAAALPNAHNRGAILVSGAPGTGKTALLDAARRRFRRADFVILEAHCRPNDTRPNAAFVDLFLKGAALLEDAGLDGSVMEKAIDRLTGAAPPGTAHGSQPGDDLLQLSETVRQTLLSVGLPQPPIIFIHDLHWAGPTTISVLRYLLENLLTDPVFDWVPPETDDGVDRPTAFEGLVLVSFAEATHTQPLLEVASATDAIEHIALQGLDDDGLREFLQSDRVVRLIRQASDGNPLKVERILRSLPENEDAHWDRMVDGLDAPSRLALNVLAVVSGPCSELQVEKLSQSEDFAHSSLEALTQKGWVKRSLTNGRVSFEFSREEERRRWHELMPAEARQALHLRVAERLVHGLEADSERIAQHFLNAGARAEAVPYALAAAERLQSAMVHSRASLLLEQIIDTTDDQLREETLDRLASLYAAQGRTADARTTLEKLTHTLPSKADDFVARYAHLLMRQGEYSEAQRVVEQRLDAGESEATPHLGLLNIAADCAYRLGELLRAEALCRGVKQNDDEFDPHRISVRNTQGKVHLFREEFDVAEHLFRANLEASNKAGDATHEAKALINLGVVYLQRSAQDQALSYFEQARRLCEASGDLAGLSISLENLAVLHHRRQEYSSALALYHQSTAASRRLGLRAQLTTSALNLADLYLVVGDIDRAHRLAEIARQYIRRGRLRFLETQSLILDGDLARTVGDRSTAAQHYHRAISQIERGEQTNQRLGYLLWSMAELHLEQGQAADAQKYVDQVLALPAAPSESLAVRLRLTQGGIYVLTGSASEAIGELEAAASATAEEADREARWQAASRLAYAYWLNELRQESLTWLARSLEVIERVAAELPASLKAHYRNAPKRLAVREGLRRARAGLSPVPELPSQSGPSDQQKRSAGYYNPLWADRYGEFIGRSQLLFPVFNALDRVSSSDSMVLIRGESGTGKELIAAAIHRHSPRNSAPFVKVNCAAFVETLLLSELFGHERGAFTGAMNSKKGRFELADGGTLFLDEIGDISPNTQVALLRVLQEGAFERVGGQETIEVDVRVLCATHRNLEKMVEDGTFRADLYYRLRGVIIEIPALRERVADIPLLAEHFLTISAKGRRTNPLQFDRPALASLLEHSWPGNVRELENVVRSVALFTDGDTIGLPELAEMGDIFRPPSDAAVMALSEILDRHRAVARIEVEPVRGVDPAIEPESSTRPTVEPEETSHDVESFSWLETMIKETGSLADLKKRIEFEAIAGALRAEKGNITRAAKRLGMKRPRLSQIIHADKALGAIKEEVIES